MSSSYLQYLQAFKFIIEGNFYISVIVLIIGCLLSISPDYVVFEFNTDLYGELAQNLKIMLIFLAISELLIFGYCWMSDNRKMFVFVGFFLLSMIGALPFYGEVNNVEIDPNFTWFFLYTGISHLIFGLYDYMGKLA